MKIAVIKYGEESPLENHASMEIGYAADGHNTVFYVHEIMLVTYGSDAIVEACKNCNRLIVGGNHANV